MTQTTTKLIEFTQLEANFFHYDEGGDLPYAMFLAASPTPDPVVENTIKKITDFWTEYLRNNPTDNVDLSRISTTKISYGHSEDDDNLTDIIITPDTLVMILSYSEDRERIVTLELSSMPGSFTVH